MYILINKNTMLANNQAGTNKLKTIRAILIKMAINLKVDIKSLPTSSLI
jgi:hypothetical protein